MRRFLASRMQSSTLCTHETETELNATGEGTSYSPLASLGESDHCGSSCTYSHFVTLNGPC